MKIEKGKKYQSRVGDIWECKTNYKVKTMKFDENKKLIEQEVFICSCVAHVHDGHHVLVGRQYKFRSDGTYAETGNNNTIHDLVKEVL